jgi:hypothetical protein
MDFAKSYENVIMVLCQKVIDAEHNARIAVEICKKDPNMRKHFVFSVILIEINSNESRLAIAKRCLDLLTEFNEDLEIYQKFYEDAQAIQGTTSPEDLVEYVLES